jgi:hypothetical protein
MFLAKEFRAHLSPELIKYRSNPLLVAKLDIKVLPYFLIPNYRLSLDLIFPESSKRISST